MFWFRNNDFVKVTRVTSEDFMGSEERICRLEKLSGILSMIISSSTDSSSIDPPH